MHPVVAAAIRRDITAAVRDAADCELAAYWRDGGDRVGGRAGAALAALPYLVRRQDGTARRNCSATRYGMTPC
jgi:hypothetical protein